jgi:hypothetical protein
MLCGMTLCAIVAAQYGYVQRRNAARQEIVLDGGIVYTWEKPCRNPALQRLPRREIPIWRRWLGDEAIQIVAMPAGSERSECARATAIFPEASVGTMQPRPF